MWKTDFKVCFCSPTRWSWCSMILWCLFTQTLRCALVAQRKRLVFLSNGRIFQSSIVKEVFMCSIMLLLLRVSTSESMIPRPCFQILQTSLVYYFTASLLPAILLPSTARQQALFWCRYYCSYSFILLVFHYLFAELVHLYI